MPSNPVTITLTLDDPPGHFWFDNGLVWLCIHKGEGTYSIEELTTFLMQHLVTTTGNTGKFYDERTQSIQEYKRKNWLPPLSNFIKVNPRAPKITINGQTFFTRPPEYRLEFNKFSKKPGTCHICQKEAPLMDARMWLFPFTIAPDKFGNFYSMARGGLKLCPRCAVCGLAAYLSWFWYLDVHSKTLHLFLFHTAPQSLAKLHQTVFEYLKHSAISNTRNVKVAFYGAYLHETLLGLLLYLFQLLHEKDASLDEEALTFLQEILESPIEHSHPLRLYGISGTLGQAFQAKTFYEFNRLQFLYRLYNRWIEELSPSSHQHPSVLITQFFESFWRREGKSTNTLWRNQIAYHVLELEDFFPSVEDFLFQKDSRPLRYGSDTIITVYAKEVLTMQPELLQVLKGFGHSLGQKAAHKSEMGLLYALRNAKSMDEFLKVLNDIQFRLELTVPHVLLQVENENKIAGTPWQRVKTLLSIFAMNSYLRASQSVPSTPESTNEA